MCYSRFDIDFTPLYLRFYTHDRQYVDIEQTGTHNI